MSENNDTVLFFVTLLRLSSTTTTLHPLTLQRSHKYSRLTRPWLLVLTLWAFTSFKAAAQKAEFTVSSPTGCSPVNIQFTNMSSGGVIKHFWRLGNGNTSVLKDPGAVYLNVGSYTVTLIVEDGNGNKDSITKANVITVFGPPVAKFTQDKTKGCKGLTVAFTDQSTIGSAAIVKRTWDFGDGVTSTATNPTHSYPNSGIYEVKLAVEDANGCKHTITVPAAVRVFKEPVVSFRMSDSVDCVGPITATFTPQVTVAQSGGTIQYRWTTSDGQTSSATNPTFTFNSTGVYGVTLEVTDSAGCKATITRNNAVRIGKETADFTVSNKLLCAGDQVSFSNRTKPGSSDNAYLWKFGDGKTQTAINPFHAYATPGTYTATLIVTSIAGCIDSFSVSGIEVRPIPKARFTVNDSISCKIPATIQFTDQSVDGKAVLWTFGDGATSLQQNPTHTYTQEGVYKVQMSAQNDAGCQNTIIKENFIVVGPTIVGVFAKPREGCNPLKVQFTSSIITNDESYTTSYDFGDGNTSTLPNPEHTYQAPTGGQFLARLTVTTKRGCVVSDTIRIKVGIPPVPDFDANPKHGCVTSMREVKFTNFTNNGSIKADSFVWDFGINVTSYEENPIINYRAKPKKYDVVLKAFFNGCEAKISKKDFIEILPPYADFELNKNACDKYTRQVRDSSIGSDSISYYVIEKGATIETIKEVRSPLISFPIRNGSYILRQVVYNNITGCTDTFEEKIDIINPVRINSITASKRSGCAPLQVDFKSNLTDNRVLLKWAFNGKDTSEDSEPKITFTKPGKYDVFFQYTDLDGCVKDTTLKEYIVVGGPLTSLQVDKRSGCTPMTVRIISAFQAIDTLQATLDMGDGTVLPITNDTMYYTYTRGAPVPADGFIITQTIKDQQCTATDTFRVFVEYANTFFFTLYNTSLCGNTEVLFRAGAASDPTYTFSWSINGGPNVDGPILIRNFSTSQEVIISFTVKKGSCVINTIDTIYINAGRPTAKFNVTPSIFNCPPKVVKFDNQSILGADTNVVYEWKFSDGSTSSQRSPEKLFLTPGTITVSLTVRDSRGCVDSFTSPNPIEVRGPKGSYSFDNTLGCPPLKVNFTSASTDATRFTWDLGDGTIAYGKNVSHTYKLSGTYIPLLILSDSTGCTYPLPPIDTIVVQDIPVPNFASTYVCQGEPTQLTDLTPSGANNKVVSWLWDFGDGGTSTEQNPSYVFKRPGKNSISLRATNEAGCVGVATVTKRIGGVLARFTTTPQIVCVGSPTQFFDASIADTTRMTWFWDFGDGSTSSTENPTHTYSQAGLYTIRFVTRDVVGCVDSFFDDKFLVGDTTIPADPDIYSVSVTGDKQVRLIFHPFTEPDFYKYFILRGVRGGPMTIIDSISVATDTIFTDNKVPDTRRESYSYRVLVQRTCGFISPGNSPPHSTIELQAAADFNAVRLNWQAYQGWTVDKYAILRERKGSVGQFDKIAEVDGSILSYTDTMVNCNIVNKYRILASELGSDATSFSDTAGARPIYVENLPQGIFYRVTVDNGDSIRVQWLNSHTASQQRYMVEKSDNGLAYYQVSSAVPNTTFSLSDNDVEVNNQSYFYRVRLIDSCGGVGSPSTVHKSILLKTEANTGPEPKLRWSSYGAWAEGVDRYEIDLKQSDGTWNKIAQTTASDTAWIDDITDLTSLGQFCYRVRAINAQNFSLISESNYACARLKALLWVPNAFSPNADTLNNVFRVKGLFIRTYQIRIFDRWGTEVYNSTDINAGWDGRFKGGVPIMDAYRYIITAVGQDDQPIEAKGWVTIVN